MVSKMAHRANKENNQNNFMTHQLRNAKMTHSVTVIVNSQKSFLIVCVCVQAGRPGPAACCCSTSRWAPRRTSSSAWRLPRTRRWPRSGWAPCIRCATAPPHFGLLQSTSWKYLGLKCTQKIPAHNYSKYCNYSISSISGVTKSFMGVVKNPN